MTVNGTTNCCYDDRITMIDDYHCYNFDIFFMFPVSGGVYRFNNVSRGQGSFIHWNSVAW